MLTKLDIKNFRCFEDFNLDIDSHVTLIEGENGTGKTSILEALYYLCYLKSFKTHITKELINEKSRNFFIKAVFNTQNEIQAGFSDKKRLIKINNKSVSSYKELLDNYRVVILTEDDLNLIKGGPDIRRSFMDQFILLNGPDKLGIFKKLRKILDNRNALLQKNSFDNETYALWTRQLWEQSRIIRDLRINSLKLLEGNVNALFCKHFPDKPPISFNYITKKLEDSDEFDDFMINNSTLWNDERMYKRSLFGAHLDDFCINFSNRKSKSFASRGQQKLIILLIKIAQVAGLQESNDSNSGSVLFLMDDFMTDFDLLNLNILLPLICTLNAQLIITCPIYESPIKSFLLDKKACFLRL